MQRLLQTALSLDRGWLDLMVSCAMYLLIYEVI